MTERYANNPASTLNGAINNSVTTLVVTSATGFSTQPNFRLLIDSEYLLVTAVAGASFTVTRGIEGSTAASHSNGAAVTQLLTAGGLQQLMTDHTSATDPHSGKYPTLSTVTTKGDLTPATGNAAVGRLAVGADNLPLVADSAQTTGLRYGGAVSVADLIITGLSGATASVRFVGATASGAPVSGTFAVGDVVVDQTGKFQLCTVAGSPGTWVAISSGSTGPTGATGPQGSTGAPGPISVVSSTPYICFQDQKSSGTAGGTFTSGAWQTRTLNTVISNDGNLASLLANQITLPAGTYRCNISCPAWAVGRHQARLQNITAGNTLLLGTSEWTNTGGSGAETRSVIAGRFSLSTATVIQVQHQGVTTEATNGFGVEAGSGFTVAMEVYAIAEFWLEGLPSPISRGMTDANPQIEYTRRRSQSAWAAM